MCVRVSLVMVLIKSDTLIIKKAWVMHACRQTGVVKYGMELGKIGTAPSIQAAAELLQRRTQPSQIEQW